MLVFTATDFSYSYPLVLLAVLLILVIAACYTYISGLYYQVQIETGCPIFGTVLIAYKFYIGSNGSTHSRVITEIDSVYGKLANKQVIKICYDDPRKVCAHKRRFLVGVVLSDENMNMDSTLEAEFKNRNFKVVCISRISNAKGKLCAYPYIEFYQDRMIHFVVPLCEQQKFMVQEYEETVLSDSYYEVLKKIK